ncbi:hypothetical protein Peur_061267 [Populus x canadensis]
MHDKFGSIDMIMLSSSLLSSAIRWRRRLKVLGNRKKDELHEKSMYAKWLKTCIYKLIMYFSCILWKLFE